MIQECWSEYFAERKLNNLVIFQLPRIDEERNIERIYSSDELLNISEGINLLRNDCGMKVKNEYVCI